MKKNYSAPAITAYGVETASMLMGSTYINSVREFDGNDANLNVIKGEIDTGTDGEGYPADEAW